VTRETELWLTKDSWCNSFSSGQIQSNFGGNGTKSLRLSVNASLKKLKTDYIDLVCLLLLVFMVQSLTTFQAISTLVGLYCLDSGIDAKSQNLRNRKKGPLPRYIRCFRMDRRPSQRVRMPKQPPPIFRTRRTMVRSVK
jgi:hypothetical protein